MMPEHTVTLTVLGRAVAFTSRHEGYLRGFLGADLSELPICRLAATAPPGSAYLDAGANVGVTAIAAALSRPDVRVIAFEPVPSNYELLERNIVAAGAPNCTAVRAAVSSRAGVATISDDGPWSRIGVPGPQIETIALDGWVASSIPETSIALIKIDVE
ncbi:MAG: FkbM family methyltransferase, partial [Acetobacteraceae bacterium]